MVCSNTNKDSLVLFTSRFPFKPSEEFLETEIVYLSKAFGKIHIFPVNDVRNREARKLPDNVIVHEIPEKNFRRLHRLMRVFRERQGLSWLIKEWKNMTVHSSKARLHMINWLGNALLLKDEVERQLLKNKDVRSFHFYSYWLNASALTIAILKEKEGELKAFSRAHGYDLYTYRHEPPYLPFQMHVIESLSKLFVISNDGYRYLVDQDKRLAECVEVSRLGTLKPEKRALRSQDGTFRVVTCAYMLPVKRLHLLIQALKKCSSIIEWTHIGDGPLREELEKSAKALPDNIKWQFLGYRTNAEVMAIYRNEPVDLFVSVSESEGVPVTIMEAYSYGVPALATNVGGVSEIVNDQNGILVHKDITSSELSQVIEKYIENSPKEKQEKSNQAYMMWSSNFNAEKNYIEFTKRMKEIGE